LSRRQEDGASSDPQDRFDPARWAAIQEGTVDPPPSVLFRRGRELARDTVLAHWPTDRPEFWLDLGCGPGHLLRDLARLGRDALGIDHDPAMLRFARTNVLGGEGRALLAADATRLPLADGSLDGVVAVSLLGCVPDLDAVLRESARVLRPGGLLIATVTSGASLLRRAEHLVALLTGRRRGTSSAVRAYSIGDVAQLLHAAGFLVERWSGYGFHVQGRSRIVPGAATSRALEHWAPGALGARIARNVLLVARRA
jgi:SAM-dependent methyltransferase